MSRGPGRIERAIRALFDAHPDEAFTTDDLCVASYPGLDHRKSRRKHQVAALRAANKVIATDPDWQSRPSPTHRNKVVFCNRASVPSMVMQGQLHGTWPNPTHEAALKRMHNILEAPDKALSDWDRRNRERASHTKSAITWPGATPAQRSANG
ncbi:MAG: hypothetical protein JOZ05_25675 [Acetobacteraceae bacterium]|nr:hypothetical protein [Acetobacteraceae bacterium]